MLKYMKGSKHIKFTSRVLSVSVVNWWVDASYNTRNDCRGHTGTMMSLGKGGVLSLSLKKIKL